MILLITPSARTRECAAALEQATGEPVECADSFRGASRLLRAGEYSTVLFDESLVDTDTDSAEVALQHAGNAVPVYVNLAISDTERVVRTMRQAIRRNRRQRETARAEAESALRNELRDSVTAILLSCELALGVAGLPGPAESKIRSVYELANELRSRLGIAVARSA